jgi:hypothetical protein
MEVGRPHPRGFQSRQGAPPLALRHCRIPLPRVARHVSPVVGGDPGACGIVRVRRETAGVASRRAIIDQAARRYGISPSILYGVWGAESNFGRNPGRSRGRAGRLPVHAGHGAESRRPHRRLPLGGVRRREVPVAVPLAWPSRDARGLQRRPGRQPAQPGDAGVHPEGAGLRADLQGRRRRRCRAAAAPRGDRLGCGQTLLRWPAAARGTCRRARRGSCRCCRPWALRSRSAVRWVADPAGASAAPVMPQGAQTPLSGGGPAPKPDVSALLELVRTAGGDVAHANVPGVSKLIGGGGATGGRRCCGSCAAWRRRDRDVRRQAGGVVDRA